MRKVQGCLGDVRVQGILRVLALLLGASSMGGVAQAQLVRINEVMSTPESVGSGFDELAHEWIEIHNPSAGSVDLTGWVISNRDAGSDVVLPALILPAGCWVTIHQTTGVDDFDFSDLVGHHYTANAAVIFDDDADECALYSGTPGSGTIVDFVAWSRTGFAPGTAHDQAVTAGIWTSDTFVPMPLMEGGDTLARYFDGYDLDRPQDWRVLSWSLYAHSGAYLAENPVQALPPNRSATNDTTPTFDWTDVPDATSYDLEVDDDPTFQSPEISVSVSASSFTPTTPLPAGGYFHRVRASIFGPPTPWAAEWSVLVDPSLPRPAEGGPGNCLHLWQRKDTQLLCIWDERNGVRGGCPETGSCRWDVPHPDSNPDTNGCAHGRMYCVPTSIAMVNRRYGGDLSRDRAAYQLNSPRRPEPEGDLGHNRGYPPPSDPTEANGLSWALNGAAITVHANPTFVQLAGWVDTYGCYMARIPGHMIVVDGYFDVTIGGTTAQVLYTEDPWNGPVYRYVYSWVFGGMPQPFHDRRHSTTRIAHAFIPPVDGVTARMQEGSVTTDSDGDGVMDFDEGLPINASSPRTLQSHRFTQDTDLDQVPDKNDIRNYTFHDQYHAHNNDALTFSDWDQDGLRSENDCDSDGRDAVFGNGDFDGGEDIDGDGHNPEAGETCMFDTAAWLESVSVDKDVYLLGENVRIVDVHGSRETHTYHANSTYWYELDMGCPDKANDTPLSHDGTFTTDAGGHAIETIVMQCAFPLQYYLTVDVLGDFNYSEPDNTDPQTCWRCADIESFCPLGGTAQGGTVIITIEGVQIVISTFAGQTAVQVLQALADAINSHPTLMAMEIVAIVRDGVLLTNGVINSFVINDPGLFRVVSGVPAMPAYWLVILVALATIGGALVLRAQGGRALA